MINTFRSVHVSAYVVGPLLGAFVALVIAPSMSSWDSYWWRLHDQWRPVATIVAENVSRNGDEVVATIRLTRHRGECKFVKPAAFQEFTGVPAARINAARADGLPWVNVPAGMEFSARWRFWPVAEGGRLRLVMEYTCDGRTVQVEAGGLS